MTLERALENPRHRKTLEMCENPVRWKDLPYKDSVRVLLALGVIEKIDGLFVKTNV